MTPPARTSPADTIAGFAALTTGVALIALLHVLPGTADISPVRRTISQYALTDSRWIFDLGVALVAVGSAVLFYALVRRGLIERFSAASVFGGLWTVSLLLIVAFPKTNWAIGPSLGGTIHRYASVVAFVALPLAVIFGARTVFRHSPFARRLAVFFGITSLLWFGLILLGVVNMLAGGEPWWTFVPLGLVERLMALNEMFAIAALGFGALRAQPVAERMTQVTPKSEPVAVTS
ncbi:DUF998 domain-containing protein [Amycolatopsis albispora]|uniref:DUF998 domain-containing protein n=1 Tax=Amycolatopsis albispora TaxID=1804986 RepID=A0A344L1V0_9PSEU|nr:DUF998 domain-containing protein [Amycolatopsis albispora]AXB42024.1 hypothetical protein A4R43_05360 [Amycolatopsis albispora]